MKALLLYVTVPTEAEATTIARTLVEERLVACAQLVPGMTSFYRWQGEIHRDSEVLLLLKTRIDGFSAVEERIRELHSYEVPQIVAAPLVQAHGPYLDWLIAQTD